MNSSVNTSINWADSDRLPTVVVGVTGGIAAYKTVTLIRLLRKAGIKVFVIPTPAALKMVGQPTWEAISGNPVYVNTAEVANNVNHIRFGQNADLIVVAPATANTIAKFRAGIADNLLCNTLLAANCDILFAPAMHSEMWLNLATQENIKVLTARGIKFIGPESGQLTGKDSGIGRMCEPAEIFTQICNILAENNFPIDNFPLKEQISLPLSGKNILITGGGTHEPIDPVRYIGNNSTGLMAVSLTQALIALGASVNLISANISENLLRQLSPLIQAKKLKLSTVNTAHELQENITADVATADAIIMAAAVSDYRVKNSHDVKIKRNADLLRLELIPNPDILQSLIDTRAKRKTQLIVGFAAETGNSEKTFMQLGIEKAIRKGADLLVVNEVGEKTGFGNVATQLFVVDKKGNLKTEIFGEKKNAATQLANFLSDQILAL